MPRVSGIFDQFENLDQITIEDITKWLIRPPDPTTILNYIGNRILYPQTVSVSISDLHLDLALLREALKGKKGFFSLATKKITIPEIFSTRIPDLSQLTWAFIDAYLLDISKKTEPEVWSVVLKGEQNEEVIGSVITPRFQKGGRIEINLKGKLVEIKQGGLKVIPCLENCQIKFQFQRGKMLDKTQGTTEVSGGRLGLVVDGRIL